jgi:hypothetical protein
MIGKEQSRKVLDQEIAINADTDPLGLCRRNQKRSRENCAFFAFDSNLKIPYIWLSNY